MSNAIYLVESLMLSVLLFFCVHATVTDLKWSVIKNKLLAAGFILAVILNFVYYFFFAQDLFLTFMINLLVMTFLSVVFYATHIWAAGDSKFLIFVICLIPARLYFSGVNVAATVLILICIFSLAFLYYIGESVVIGLKERNLFSFRRMKLDGLRMAVQYVKCTCIVSVANFLFSLVFGDFYSANTELFMIINMLLVFAVCNVRWLDRWYVLLFLGAATVAIVIFQERRLGTVNWLIYLLVLVVVVLRIIAEKYNYKTIPTAEVKPGMVLSYGTVVLFLPSRIMGLPTSTTEDIRSRISPEEAASIQRWETSKYGQPQITIVRKIPFAIFISLGTFVFITVRILF